MKRYIPKTITVNKDRLYFITENSFIKVDSNRERGVRESAILKSLNHPSIPKIIRTFEYQGKHAIEMTICRGETLENLLLNQEQKINVISKLLEIIAYLLKEGIVHGDINESNVIFDGENIYLIDFEMARKEQSLIDIFGPPWGLLYIINWLFSKCKNNQLGL